MLRIIIGSAIGGFILIVLIVVVLVAACAVAIEVDGGSEDKAGEAIEIGTAVLISESHNVTVEVGGDTGIAFSGSTISPLSGGLLSVNGTTPETFTIAGPDSIISRPVAVIQKVGAGSGRLIVTLRGCENGDKRGETTAAFGVVTLTC